MTIPSTLASRAAQSTLVLALVACGKSTPPSMAEPVPPPQASSHEVAPPPPPASAAAVPLDAGAPRPRGRRHPAAIVADNKVEPTQGAELQERAKGLFDAIVADDPDRAEAFWFPREPFIPLKDVKDPGKYWTQLHKTYVSDVHALHRKRKSWEGATFVEFDGWTQSKWVPPGDEANKSATTAPSTASSTTRSAATTARST